MQPACSGRLEVHAASPPYATESYVHSLMTMLPDAWKPPRATPLTGPGSAVHTPDAVQFWYQWTQAVAVPQSSMFLPVLNPDVVSAALELVPSTVFPREDDTPATLAQRILQANFFDDLRALVGGGQFGPTRVELNGTVYRQPRRKSWSLVVREIVYEHGELVRTMYAYGKPNSRIRTEINADPMPWAICELGIQCFLAAQHALCSACASSPPNHCQLLGYYGLFDSKCGRHKDDHKLDTLHRVLLNRLTVEEAVMTTKGAMKPGADVLVFSTGPLPVLFSYCFTRNGRRFVGRMDHEICPAFSRISLPNGSLFVFKAVDDLYFYHEVEINWRYAKRTDHRFAFVFRWLEKECDFPC